MNTDTKSDARTIWRLNNKDKVKTYRKRMQNKIRMCYCCNKTLKYQSWFNHIKTASHRKNEYEMDIYMENVEAAYNLIED